MKQYAKDAAWFCLGLAFAVSLLLPLGIIAIAAIFGGHMDRGE